MPKAAAPAAPSAAKVDAKNTPQTGADDKTANARLERFEMTLTVTVEAKDRAQALAMVEQKVNKLKKSWGVTEVSGELA